MNLQFSAIATQNYHSPSQIARIKTEAWVADNLYCPRCGHPKLNHFNNNRPVADFYCPNCQNEFELKSKSKPLSKKMTGSAYSVMIDRITSNKNPDFLFMNYSKDKQCVIDLILIPKSFFTPDIVEKRKPLSPTARRAGWVGCNILISKIPKQGIIEIVKNGKVCDINDVINKVNNSKLLAIPNLSARSWLLDVLNCINMMPQNDFSLQQLYQFTNDLAKKHPKNNNIQAKIRQQLQLLRNLGFVDFLGKGQYKRLK